MKRFLALAVLLCMAFGTAAAQEEYPDGIYRGFYYDGGIEQIAIQFEIRNGLFESIVYRGVNYKDGNYLSENASDAQKATLRQYHQLRDYLIGKGISAIDDLYFPYDIVDDVDAVTTATIQSSKLISALWDGLNRRPFKLLDTSKLPVVSSYADGTYRGSYMEEGTQQISLEFTLKDGRFVSIFYRDLFWKEADYLSAAASDETRQVAGQYQALLNYLQGRPVSAVNDLYLPGNIAADTDAASGATLPAPKVISAIWDALNRHAYQID